MGDAVLVQRDGAVAVITMNRPESLNSLSADLCAGLDAALAAARADAGVRAVLLTGAGRGFCAGGDLKEIAPGLSATAGRAYMQGMHRWLLKLATLEKPVVAAVNGFAMGAGFNVALACDLIIAAEDARFGQVFDKVGLISDLGGLFFLARSLGLHRAKELVFSGRVLAAAEAQALGLVARVVPAAELYQAALAVAQELAAGPTIAYGLNKRLLLRSFDLSLEEALEAEACAQAECFQTEDHRVGIQAFLARQRPEFQGR